MHIKANGKFEKCRGNLCNPLLYSLGEAYVKGNRGNDAVCGKSKKNI